MHAPVVGARRTGAAGCVVVAAPLTERVHPPGCQGGRALRDRRHRPAPAPPPGPAAGPATDGFFDDLGRGSFVVHRQHGVARFDGVTTRTMGGTTRDYLILQYRGSDRLYLPVDQIEAITPYSGGESPDALQDGRRRLAAHPGQGPGRGRRGRRGAGRAVPAPPGRGGPRLRARHPVADRDGGVLRLRRDRGPAQGHRRREGGHGGAPADGPPGLRRRRLRQDRGGGAGRLQGRPGRDAGGRAGADHAAGQPARPDLRRALRALPGARRAVEPLPLPRPGAERSSTGLADGRSTSSSAPTGCWPGRAPSRTSACSWSTRSSASGSPTRRR